MRILLRIPHFILLKLRKAMDEYKQKRDEYNMKVKELAEQLKELKKSRDENNSKVAFYKEIRQTLRKKRKELLEEYRALKENVRKPKTSSWKIRQLIDKLEWRLQTVPMTIEQENAIVSRIRELEEKLDEIKEQEEKYKRLKELRKEISKLTEEIKKYHELVVQHAKQSQEIHQKIIQLREEINKYRQEADKYHANYTRLKEEVNSKLEELTKLEQKRRELYSKIKEISIRVAAEKAAQKIRREKELIEEKAKIAMDKLQRGEQLTFEEFVDFKKLLFIK